MRIGLMVEGQAGLTWEYAESGLEEFEFELFSFASDEVPEHLASEISPRVAGLKAATDSSAASTPQEPEDCLKY
ncbi:MAG: hypothetical protein IIB28_08480 [Chloroflexi bacterium]|nr:hypothetical protein [Chloroflexota bacterium]